MTSTLLSCDLGFRQNPGLGKVQFSRTVYQAFPCSFLQAMMNGPDHAIEGTPRCTRLAFMLTILLRFPRTRQRRREISLRVLKDLHCLRCVREIRSIPDLYSNPVVRLGSPREAAVEGLNTAGRHFESILFRSLCIYAMDLAKQ